MRLRVLCPLLLTAAFATPVLAATSVPKIAVQIVSATSVGEVTVRLTNAGETPSGKFSLEMTAVRRDKEVARAEFSQASLDAHESRVVPWDLKLPDGTYVVRARALVGTTLLEEEIAAMRVGKPPSNSAPGIGRGVAVVVAVMLAAVSGIILLYARRRRLTRTARR
ncbi:MAG: hypothetical protein WDA27_12795 [Actinomycetota bacterium]